MEQGKLKDFVMSMHVESKVGTREHEIIHGKVPDESKVIKC